MSSGFFSTASVALFMDQCEPAPLECECMCVQVVAPPGVCMAADKGAAANGHAGFPLWTLTCRVVSLTSGSNSTGVLHV